MRLSSLLGNTVQLPIELDRISMDGELIADIQGQLALACILDPPIDRTFGPVTRWALKIFAAKHGLQAETHLDRDLVAALLSPQTPRSSMAPQQPFPRSAANFGMIGARAPQPGQSLLPRPGGGFSGAGGYMRPGGGAGPIPAPGSASAAYGPQL